MLPLILVSIFIVTLVARSASGRTDPAFRVGARIAQSASVTSDPSVDPQVTYWHAKAVKRLHLLGKRERRIVALLVRIHKLRTGRGQVRSASVGSPAIPHRSAWECIHRYEGSWTDAGDPYWGGLQFDKTFMRTYAPAWLLSKGWANSWTPLEQMYVAERAWRTRGFYPWPTTARMCGLI